MARALALPARPAAAPRAIAALACAAAAEGSTVFVTRLPTDGAAVAAACLAAHAIVGLARALRRAAAR